MKHFVFCVSGYSGSGKDELTRPLTDAGFPKVGLSDPAKRHVAELYGFTEDQVFGPSSSRNAGDPRYLKAGLAMRARAPSAAGGLPACDVVTPSGIVESAVPGDPAFWLSPREALQVHCETMNRLYEDTWVRRAMEVHRTLGTTVRGPDGTALLPHGYDRMDGVFPNPPGTAAPAGGRHFVSCSADFRHLHEVRLARLLATPDFVPVLIRVTRPSVPAPPYRHRSEVEMSTIPDSAFDFVVDNSGSVADLHSEMRRIADAVLPGGLSLLSAGRTS